MNTLATIGAMFIQSLHCADRVQFRFPRSKKKRIRQKWAKRPENFRTVPWKNLYRLPDGSFLGHPATIKAVLVRNREKGD